MSLLKNLLKLADGIPTCRPILQQVEEILNSLKRNVHSAQSKDIRSQIADVQRQVNATKKEMDKLTPQHTLDINYGANKSGPFDQLIKDCSSINKPKNPPPSGGGPLGGGNNPGHGGGPMLGGGGLGPLWK